MALASLANCSIRPLRCTPRHFRHTDTCCIYLCRDTNQLGRPPVCPYPPPFAISAKRLKLEFSEVFGAKANSIYDKTCQSNLAENLSGRLISLWDDLSPCNILKKVVPLRNAQVLSMGRRPRASAIYLTLAEFFTRVYHLVISSADTL